MVDASAVVEVVLRRPMADVLGARLLTLDRRLAAAVREHTAVELAGAG